MYREATATRCHKGAQAFEKKCGPVWQSSPAMAPQVSYIPEGSIHLIKDVIWQRHTRGKMQWNLQFVESNAAVCNWDSRLYISICLHVIIDQFVPVRCSIVQELFVSVLGRAAWVAWTSPCLIMVCRFSRFQSKKIVCADKWQSRGPVFMKSLSLLFKGCNW